MIVAVALAALAQEPRVVRPGDTVGSMSGQDPVLEEAIRRLNGLDPGDEPPVGAIVLMPDAGATVGRLIGVEGNATIAAPGGTATVGRFGDLVPLGSTVCVDAKSYATVRVATAAQSWRHDDITLLPGTCVRVDAAAARPGGRASLISIERGEVAVVDGDAEGRVLVRTPGVVTSAAGGGFRVALERADTTRAESVTANTSVIAGGAELQLGPGQGARAYADGRIEGPTKLLPAAAPLKPAADVQLRRPEFAWTDVPDAVAFRVTFGADPAFSSVITVETVYDVVWEPTLLFLSKTAGVVWWRVDAIDRTGMVGLPSEPRLLHFPTGVAP